MVRDIAIALAHSGEPPLVFNGECWLNAEGRIYLAASGVNLAKLRKVSRQVHAGPTEIWRTLHGNAEVRQGIRVPSQHKIGHPEPHKRDRRVKRIIANVPLADFDRPSVLMTRRQSAEFGFSFPAFSNSAIDSSYWRMKPSTRPAIAWANGD
jgi:hypothetical protein